MLCLSRVFITSKNLDKFMATLIIQILQFIVCKVRKKSYLTKNKVHEYWLYLQSIVVVIIITCIFIPLYYHIICSSNIKEL